MKYRFDPEGQRLPIKLDSTSNAEYTPIPLERRDPHHLTFGPKTRREFLRFM